MTNEPEIPFEYLSKEQLATEIAKIPTTSTRIGGIRQHDDAGEHYVQYHVHEFNRFLSEEEATEWVKDNYPATRCQHSHDCCGNFYASNATWTRIQHYGDAEILVIRQCWSANI